MSSEAISYFPEGLSGVVESEQTRQIEAVEQSRVETASEESLLMKVGQGSKEALAQLYDRLARTIYGVAARILRDEGEAEDLVHEVFLSLSKNANRFDPAKGSARTWIFCMVSNRALDRRDFLNTRRHYQSEELVESHFRLSQAVDSEQASVNTITAQKLMELLPKVLSPEQRRTLELHLYRGATFREIAEQAGVPLSTILMQYQRGCARLRKHILQRKDAQSD